jgi:hypothetical protein
MIDYETTRLRRLWSPQDLLHRRAIAAQRQCKLAALLGLDTGPVAAAAAYWKRSERAGIARLQRAEGAARISNDEEHPETATQSSRLFHQARRGSVLPRFLVTRRDTATSGLRARAPAAEANE